jgi:response regulator NasT
VTARAPRILLVDQNPARARVLEEGLREAGYREVVVIEETANLLKQIDAIEPDVIFIDIENPNRDVLEQMFQVSRVVRRPIAMLVGHSDTDMIEAAVEAGIGAYVVDELRKERVKPILDMCISRFKTFAKLHDELKATRAALEERKLIDRAKGVLMKELGLTEDDAYVLLRKTAMDRGQRVADVARNTLQSAHRRSR